MNKELVTRMPRSGGRALIAGGLAALLASACCLGPLVLVLVGISGAWISNLAGLAPYQPIFVAASVAALFYAWRQIWRPVACAPDQVCAVPRVNLATSSSLPLLIWLTVKGAAHETEKIVR